jgi:hypothetical protein
MNLNAGTPPKRKLTNAANVCSPAFRFSGTRETIIVPLLGSKNKIPVSLLLGTSKYELA